MIGVMKTPKLDKMTKNKQLLGQREANLNVRESINEKSGNRTESWVRTSWRERQSMYKESKGQRTKDTNKFGMFKGQKKKMQ